MSSRDTILNTCNVDILASCCISQATWPRLPSKTHVKWWLSYEQSIHGQTIHQATIASHQHMHTESPQHSSFSCSKSAALPPSVLSQPSFSGEPMSTTMRCPVKLKNVAGIQRHTPSHVRRQKNWPVGTRYLSSTCAVLATSASTSRRLWQARNVTLNGAHPLHCLTLSYVKDSMLSGRDENPAILPDSAVKSH